MKAKDYVRTKYGIAKLTKIEDEEYFFDSIVAEYNSFYEHGYLKSLSEEELNENIIKSSPNIINLIQLGDLVRLFVEDDVNKEDTNIFEVVAIPNDRKTIGVFTGDFEIEFFPVDNLRGIVTHEQFESMEYKVKE